MTRAKASVMPEAIEQIEGAVTQCRVSHLESKYGQFHEKTIAASGPAGRLMAQLNTIYTVLSGLGAVLRIVDGNRVIADAYDPDDPASDPPLSDSVISQLTSMTGAICELIADDIDGTAVVFNERGQA